MNKSTLLLTVSLVIIIVIVTVAFILPYREENKIYLSVVESLGSKSTLKNLAFMSSPSNCYLSKEKDKEYFGNLHPDLLSAFFEANEGKPSPVKLNDLEGKYNIVSWKDTKEITNVGKFSLMFKQSDKRIITFSRVGFNPSRNVGLLCVEAEDFGGMFLVEKGINSWKVVSFWKAWGH